MVISHAKRYIFQPYLHPLIVQGHIYLVFFGGASSIGTWATLYLLQWYHIAFNATSAKEMLLIQTFLRYFGIKFSLSYASSFMFLWLIHITLIHLLWWLYCLPMRSTMSCNWQHFMEFFNGVILSHTLAIF